MRKRRTNHYSRYRFQFDRILPFLAQNSQTSTNYIFFHFNADRVFRSAPSLKKTFFQTLCNFSPRFLSTPASNQIRFKFHALSTTPFRVVTFSKLPPLGLLRLDPAITSKSYVPLFAVLEGRTISLSSYRELDNLNFDKIKMFQSLVSELNARRFLFFRFYLNLYRILSTLAAAKKKTVLYMEKVLNL